MFDSAIFYSVGYVWFVGHHYGHEMVDGGPNADGWIHLAVPLWSNVDGNAFTPRWWIFWCKFYNYFWTPSLFPCVQYEMVTDGERWIVDDAIKLLRPPPDVVNMADCRIVRLFKLSVKGLLVSLLVFWLECHLVGVCPNPLRRALVLLSHGPTGRDHVRAWLT